jgi:hypothetical protein
MPLTDQINQPGGRLARIDWIQQNAFQSRKHGDRFLHTGRRQGIARSDVGIMHLHGIVRKCEGRVVGQKLIGALGQAMNVGRLFFFRVTRTNANDFGGRIVKGQGNTGMRTTGTRRTDQGVKRRQTVVLCDLFLKVIIFRWFWEEQIGKKKKELEMQ